MKILLTGTSSFTGTWFARDLLDAGHSVIATLRNPPDFYEGIRQERIDLLKKLGVKFIGPCSFGDSIFLAQIEEGVDGICHHGAIVENYKSLDFSASQALQENSFNLKVVLQKARDHGVRGIILTGSVFEQDEGAGDADLMAFSPYGLSKGLTWQMFRFWCRYYSMPLHKFIIPNPFGPLEDPRFCHYLVTRWAKGETPQVNTPEYVRDNIHVTLLSKAYAWFVEMGLNGTEWRRIGPSQYVETQGAFTGRFSREIGPRLGIHAPFLLGRQTDFSEPMVRINLDRLNRLEKWNLQWDEERSWDELASYYRKILTL